MKVIKVSVADGRQAQIRTGQVTILARRGPRWLKTAALISAGVAGLPILLVALSLFTRAMRGWQVVLLIPLLLLGLVSWLVFTIAYRSWRTAQISAVYELPGTSVGHPFALDTAKGRFEVTVPEEDAPAVRQLMAS